MSKVVVNNTTRTVTVTSTGKPGPVGLNWRGEWAEGVEYQARDAVYHDGSSYRCVEAHTSSEADEPGASDKWQLLALGSDVEGVAAVAAIRDEIGTVAGIKTEVEQVAAISGDVSAVSAIKDDVSAVAAVKDDIADVAGIKDDVSDVAAIKSAISTVAARDADIAVVAENASAVQVAAEEIEAIKAAPGAATSANDAADRSEAARDLAEGFRNDANDSQVAAHLSEMNARAAAAATGPVIFYDSKADADAAVGGLDEGAIVEVLQDEDHYNARTRYRVEGGALDLKIYLDILALPSIAALQTLWGLYDGQVARVVDNRQFGHFKWRAGNLTAEVASDPYQGIWVAPTIASNGSLGAWQRMVEKAEYDAEWWLPDTMPTDAQVRINAGIAALPGNCGRFIMPRREVTITDTILLKKGLTYEGHGPSSPINGGGAAIHCVTIAGNNSRLVNIHARNVAGGQIGMGEPSGFHVTDGEPIWLGSGVPVENVSIIDCSADATETGVRIGYGSTQPGGVDTVFGSRDTYVENFRAWGINGICIEAMRAHGVEAKGGSLRLESGAGGGLRRCFRLVGCHDVRIVGAEMDGPDGHTGTNGVSLEEAGNGDSTSPATTVVVEACSFGVLRNAVRVAGKCESLTVSNCIASGRNDGYSSSFIQVASESPDASKAVRSVKVSGNQALNVATFVDVQSAYIYGMEVVNNRHIANDTASARFVNVAGSVNSLRDVVFRGNTSYIKAAGTTGGTVRLDGTQAGDDVTFDDNKITPASGGVIFSGVGDASILMGRRDSNITLDTALWTTMRTALAKEVYS